MKKNICYLIILIVAVGVLCLCVENEKSNKSIGLFVEDVEMPLDTSQNLNFKVITNKGNVVTEEYLNDEMSFEIENDSIISIENGLITSLNQGRTRVKMTLYHKEQPIIGKKGVIISIIETEFEIIVSQ